MQRYCFENFVLDVSARELSRDGAPIGVPPKSLDCIVYLIEQRERAVGRDELISAVWGRVDVSDAVLAQTLRRARIAVDDDGTKQETIRTVHRFGYQWVAAIRVVDGRGAAESPAVTNPPAPPNTQVVVSEVAPTRRRRAWMLLAVVVAAITAAWWFTRTPTPSAMTPAAQSTHSALVAVMPVKLVAGAKVSNGRNAWIRLGVMDYIADRLRTVGEITVVPSSQIVAVVNTRHAGISSGPDEVRSISGSRYVVSASARQADGQWRLHLEVSGQPAIAPIDTESNSILTAASTASVRLLRAMGIQIQAAVATPRAPIDERVQRLDAALLGGDMDAATKLIDTAPAKQRSAFELRVREGRLAFRRGDLDRAKRIYSGLVGQRGQLPFDVLAIAQMGLGAVAVRRHDFAVAQRHYAAGVATLGKRNEPNLLGQAYTGLGVARAAQGDYEHASAALGRARVFLEQAGNKLDAASVDVDLGLMAKQRHRFSQAIDHFDRAIVVFQRARVNDNLAAALLGKAASQLALLDVDDASATSASAWSLATTLDNPILVNQIGNNRAHVLLVEGSLRAASEVLAALKPVGSGAATTTLLRARLALASGNPDKAWSLLAPIAGAATDQIAQALPTCVLAAIASGKVDEASRKLASIKPTPATSQDTKIAVGLARALLEQARGNTAAAATAFATAAQRARAAGVPIQTVRVETAHARFLVETQRLDQARAVIGRLAPYANRLFGVAQVSTLLYRKLGDTTLANAAEARAKQLAGERERSIFVL